MLRSACLLAFASVCFLSASSTPIQGADTEKEAPKFSLPEDPKAAVITLDYPGGQIPRKNQDPILVVRADGSLTIGDPWGQSKEFNIELKPGELQQLLTVILEDEKFFEIDPDEIQKEIAAEQRRQGGLGIAIADAATTVIEVNTADKQHKVKYYALGFAAKQYPKIEGLQRLREIEQLLNDRMHVIRAGGEEGVAKELEIANKHLAEAYPDAAPLTAGELQMAYQYANGNRRIGFSRVKLNEDGTTKSYVNVMLNYTDDAEKPMVNVSAKLK